MKAMLLEIKKKNPQSDVQSKDSISDAGQAIAKDWFDKAIKRDVPPRKVGEPTDQKKGKKTGPLEDKE